MTNNNTYYIKVSMVVAYGWGSTERVKFDLITIYRGMDNHNLLQHQLSKHNYGVKIVEWKRKLHVYIYYVASSLNLDVYDTFGC